MKWNQIIQWVRQPRLTARWSQGGPEPMDAATAGRHLALNDPSFGHAKRILIPLDLVHSTVDPLLFVQGIAAEVPICVTLLHVVDVNLAPAQGRVYEELSAEAQAGLSKLAKLFFGGGQQTRVSVRIGRASEQILAEARSSGSELIILLAGRPRPWARFFGRATAERVVRAAPCPTLVLPRARSLGPLPPAGLPAPETQAQRWPAAQREARQGCESSFAQPSNRMDALTQPAGAGWRP